jgi:hypothetical protein
MHNKISNTNLKKIISQIASKANEGRVTDISWEKLYEAKNIIKMEAEQQAPQEDPLAGDLGAPTQQGGQNAAPGEQPPAGAAQAPAPDAAAAAAPAGTDPAAAGAPAGKDAGEDDVKKAQADATKAKAELEKAKAEKDAAEEELAQQSYIKLNSRSGTNFMLGKLLSHARRTNTINTLAADMAQQLNMRSEEDIDAFLKDNAQLQHLPGFSQLVSSIKTMATKETPSTEDGEDTPEEETPAQKPPM